MMIRNSAKCLKYIILPVLFCLGASACSTRGIFETQGLTLPAKLAIRYHEPNCILNEPSYDLTLKIRDGNLKDKIKLGFIMDGTYKALDSQTVEFLCTQKQGLTVQSTDKAVEKSISVVAIKLKHDPQTRMLHYGYSVEHDYDLTVTLFNAKGKQLGDYKETLKDGLSIHPYSPEGIDLTAPVSKDPTAPSNIFAQAMRRALAEKKAAEAAAANTNSCKTQ